MPPVSLTSTQQTLLAHAIDETSGHIRWFPEGLHGGARHKVLTALAVRSLIEQDGDAWQVTEAGYLALKRPLPSFYAQSETESEPEPQPKSGCQVVFEQEPQVADAVEVVPPIPVSCSDTTSTSPRTRATSKQAQVIALLQRPEGATISQICAATEWLSHTVRGAFAGTFKKKLGLIITSEKPAGGERIYRCGQTHQSAQLIEQD